MSIYKNNEQIIIENDVHITMHENINLYGNRRNPFIRTEISSGTGNYIGVFIYKKNAYEDIIKYADDFFNGDVREDKFIIKDKPFHFFSLKNVDGELHLLVGYTPYNHAGVTVKVDLSGERLKKFIKNIKDEINQIDWSRYGKLDYIKVNLPDDKLVEYENIYSATDFEKRFKELVEGKILRMLLLDLHDFVDYSNHGYPKKNRSIWFDDCSPTLLVFDDFAVDIVIHAVGLFQYRILKDVTFSSVERVFDYVPDDIDEYSGWYNKNTFINGQSILYGQFEGERISGISVDKTWDYPFGGNDEIRAASDKEELPSRINLVFDNTVKLSLWGDDTEYYGVSAE